MAFRENCNWRDAFGRGQFPLAIRMAGARFEAMKVLSIQEAQSRLAAVCNEALAGEVIRLQAENGARLQLVPAPSAAPAQTGAAELSDADLEWAEFENHCGQASD